MPTQSGATFNFSFNHEVTISLPSYASNECEVGEAVQFGFKMAFADDKSDNFEMTWTFEVAEAFDIGPLNMILEDMAEDPNVPAAFTAKRVGEQVAITIGPKSEEDRAEMMRQLAPFLGQGAESVTKIICHLASMKFLKVHSISSPLGQNLLKLSLESKFPWFKIL